jgi:DNA polymerase-3 subunit chi
MGAVYFYHLTRSGLAETLVLLLGRALGTGWRVAVRARDPALLERLDGELWLRPEDGFLPHGLAGGPHDADQPVLLTTAASLPNGARCVMAVDGAEVSAAEATALERVCILFDGNDPAAVEAARGQWRGLTGAGVPAQYWSEQGGRWEKRAEHPPSG